MTPKGDGGYEILAKSRGYGIGSRFDGMWARSWTRHEYASPGTKGDNGTCRALIKPILSLAASNFQTIDFLNQDTGGIASGTPLIGTHNGGRSWTPVNFPRTSYHIRRIFFANREDGWVLAGQLVSSFLSARAMIFCTCNGGRTWTPESLPGAFSSQFQSMPLKMVLSSAGYALVGGPLLKAQDAGDKWSLLPVSVGHHAFSCGLYHGKTRWSRGRGNRLTGTSKSMGAVIEFRWRLSKFSALCLSRVGWIDDDA